MKCWDSGGCILLSCDPSHAVVYATVRGTFFLLSPMSQQVPTQYSHKHAHCERMKSASHHVLHVHPPSHEFPWWALQRGSGSPVLRGKGGWCRRLHWGKESTIYQWSEQPLLACMAGEEAFISPSWRTITAPSLPWRPAPVAAVWQKTTSPHSANSLWV